MTFKIVESTALKIGNYIMVNDDAYIIKSMDISKTGKHGHAKCRFEAVGIISGKKKVMVVPGHERFEVPIIEKRKAQVLSIMGDKATVMDSESFENFELGIPEELKDKVNEGITIEYWNVEGKKIIKRVL